MMIYLYVCNEEPVDWPIEPGAAMISTVHWLSFTLSSVTFLIPLWQLLYLKIQLNCKIPRATSPPRPSHLLLGGRARARVSGLVDKLVSGTTCCLYGPWEQQVKVMSPAFLGREPLPLLTGPFIIFLGT